MFSKGVILVKGSCRGLIHDFNNSKLYSLDKKSKEYLSALIDGAEVGAFLTTVPDEERQEFSTYLDMLVEKGIGKYSCSYSGKSNNLVKVVEKDIDTIWMELRKACNLHCCHCYLDCDGSRDSNMELLPLEQWKEIVSQLGNKTLKRVILIGGEPLIFKEIGKLISYIREKFSYIDIVLYSNLTLMDDKLIACILSNKVKVVTSIYSWNSEIHDNITGVKGSFKKTVAAVEKLIACGVKVKANTVVMKYNAGDINKTEEFIMKLTGSKPGIDVIRNVGKDKESLIPEGFVCDKKQCSSPLQGISEKQFIRNYSGNSCWQGKINVTCDGYVSPCIMGESFIDYNYNIKTHSMDTILKEYVIPQFWSISKDDIHECRDCEYRYVCKDCRPVCSTNGDMLLKDARCSYNPYKGER